MTYYVKIIYIKVIELILLYILCLESFVLALTIMEMPLVLRRAKGQKGLLVGGGVSWHWFGIFLALVLARSWRKILNSVSIPRHFSNYSTAALYHSFIHFVSTVCRLFSKDTKYFELFWHYLPVYFTFS